MVIFSYNASIIAAVSERFLKVLPNLVSTLNRSTLFTAREKMRSGNQNTRKPGNSKFVPLYIKIFRYDKTQLIVYDSRGRIFFPKKLHYFRHSF